MDINVDAIKRVRAALSVNLLEVLEGSLVQQISNDPILLVDVIFVVCQPEADKRGITDQQFGQAMGGDAIDRATAAFFEDLTDFFPSGQRQMLKQAMEKVEKLQGMVLGQGDETARQHPDGTAHGGVAGEKRGGNGKADAKSAERLIWQLPASSASTPADSPSDSSPG